MTLNTIKSLLINYDSISLNDSDNIKLMNRMDTKYVVPIKEIYELINDLSSSYDILNVNAQLIGNYHSTYYDTNDLRMFYAHVTGRYPRFKFRKRIYSQNGLQFLELKNKLINGRTNKIRIPINANDNFNFLINNLISNSPLQKNNLHPTLVNNFDRITLIDKQRTERLTLDFNIQFNFTENNGIKFQTFNQVAIIELKQNKKCNTNVVQYLSKRKIKPCSVSKYCVGMLLLNSELPYKLYKPNFTNFLKIAQ